MNLAAANIPTEKHSETVLYILATAGMRMISESDQEEILTAVRSEVPKMVDFVFSDSHADIITGKEEGIYAWISANFVLNKLKVHLIQIVIFYVSDLKILNSPMFFRLINIDVSCRRQELSIWEVAHYKLLSLPMVIRKAWIRQIWRNLISDLMEKNSNILFLSLRILALVQTLHFRNILTLLNKIRHRIRLKVNTLCFPGI